MTDGALNKRAGQQWLRQPADTTRGTTAAQEHLSCARACELGITKCVQEKMGPDITARTMRVTVEGDDMHAADQM